MVTCWRSSGNLHEHLGQEIGQSAIPRRPRWHQTVTGVTGVTVTSSWPSTCKKSKMVLSVQDIYFYIRRSAPRYFLVCGLAQVKCLSQGSPLKHDGRRKTTKRKKRAKGFQGFLYGTSGGRNSKGSSPGPPGRKIFKKKKIKTGTYHWEKHIACFMHICNVRSQVFFPGVWVCLRDFIYFILFFAALSASLHCGKTLGPEKSFEYGKVFQEYGWETRTFEEGKKKAPFIQGGGLRQAHTIEKVENPSSRLLIYISIYIYNLTIYFYTGRFLRGNKQFTEHDFWGSYRVRTR